MQKKRQVVFGRTVIKRERVSLKFYGVKRLRKSWRLDWGYRTWYLFDKDVFHNVDSIDDWCGLTWVTSNFNLKKFCRGGLTKYEGTRRTFIPKG